MQRTALYLRVSTEEQKLHGYSLEAQADALRQYAEEHSLTVVGEYRDEGISGRKPYKKRPALMSLIEAVKAGQIDLILFIKLDRWFRSVADYYEVQRILDSHNVAWRATQEDYETETASGRFKVNIMLSVAQDEADRTSERIRFVFESKRAKGELISGSVPLGLRIVDKSVEIDPETAHIVQEIFSTYLSLRSKRATLIEALGRGYAVSKNGVDYMLSNHRYVDAGLITQEQFGRVQALRRSREHRTVRPDRIYLFSGIIRCPSCGRPMRAFMNAGGKYAYYSCPLHNRYGDARCGYSKMWREDAIEAWILDNIATEAERHNLTVKAKRRTKQVDPAAIRRKMEKLKDLYLNDLIERDVYERDYTALRAKLDAIQPSPTIDVSKLKDVRKVYSELTRERQRAYWSRVIDHIDIDEDSLHVTFA